MPRLDEACVLLPSSALEDLPANASDADARSLLAAWTVLWHPALIAETGQLPAWYRADAPPESPGGRLFIVPTLSLAKLPAGFEGKCRDAEDCRWVTGANRAEMLDRLELPPPAGRAVNADAPSAGVQGAGVQPEDFFAFGYAMLQVQMMTRRLRYTSNLDELRVQERIVAAARAFQAGDGETSTSALHDAFDLLAEERDHYFASDPSLIDLTLLVPTTLRGWAESLAGEPLAGENSAAGTLGDTSGPPSAPKLATPKLATSKLPTPGNVLIDAETAAAIESLPGELAERVRRAIQSGEVGWAGGGPAAEVCLDSFTYQAAEQRLAEAWRATAAAVQSPPKVYARFGGTTPADLTSILVQLGCHGLIPIDFAGGTGFGEEAKVIRQAGSTEIEALTAKPIDGSSDAAFLTLASRLGESIDSGEIATALIAHWPGSTCDSLEDLRRAASWGLAVGRFWKLDDYFTDGEHPYHHENARPLSADAANRLVERVQQGEQQPLRTTAQAFRAQVRREQRKLLDGMTALARGEPSSHTETRMLDLEEPVPGNGTAAFGSGETSVNGGEEFAAAIGCRGARPHEPLQDAPDLAAAAGTAAALIINPGSTGWRQTVQLLGPAPEKGDFVYGSERAGGRANVTADVPALGFTLVSTATKSAKKRRFGWPWGGPEPIAREHALQNEFMEVAIDPSTGGVSAVHSGAVRGNRFSLRLVRSESRVSAESGPAMRANNCRVISTSLSLGEIGVSGALEATDGSVLAEFEIRYTLRRGSRLLEVRGKLRPLVELGPDPWAQSIAARVAVASDATNFRGLVRDKIHRSSSKRMVAPLGILIDEADRATLVASAGLAYHRRAGERFLDTLLAVRGESEPEFSLAYGFDVRHPVAVARSWIVPPEMVPIEVGDQAGRGGQAGRGRQADRGASPRQGWILHASPSGLLIDDVQVSRRRDGKLAAVVRVIQTRNDGGKATLRFCRDVAFAARWNGAPEVIDAEPDGAGSRLDSAGDQVKWSMGGHGVIDILVVFSSD
jgi:hypothetical protein